MDPERATLEQLADEYTAAMRESEKLAFFVRDAELQTQQIDGLIALKRRIQGFKYGARKAGDERAANMLFHLQCGLNAMISFLTMWIELKKGDHHSAWNCVVDAEEYVSIALRAADAGEGLEDFLQHVKLAEQVIFPGYPVYNSMGAVIRGGKCTVCELPFNRCEHIEGRVYWGRLCVRIHPEIVDMDHVAMVDEPRDRRCVITEITTNDGYYHDYMTLKKTRRAEDKEEGTAGRLTGVIFHNQLLEID